MEQVASHVLAKALGVVLREFARGDESVARRVHCPVEGRDRELARLVEEILRALREAVEEFLLALAVLVADRLHANERVFA
jgi:hypothetical protein